MLAGSNVQGEQYAVFGYSRRELGVDPVAYWTGKEPSENPFFDPFSFRDRIIPPPKIPIMCYFSNDVDELANLKRPYLQYNWKIYVNMINSLVRMKYNAIQLFDMLGRPEFYRKSAHFAAFYRTLRPHYNVDLTYVDKMIRYAHQMGMKVQIDMSLGYRFYPWITQSEDSCWSKYKDKWVAAWKYYMTKTPIGKCEIFSFRPRNQIWDWPYVSSCGENSVKVFDEAYAALNNVINEYHPGAIKIAMLYSSGMQVYNEGLRLPRGWIAAWSGNGWGKINKLPVSVRGYEFGTYMHAGYWLNHLVMDPYPVRIGRVMSKFIRRYHAWHYMEVNGQTFRPFILNLEAYSRFAESPTTYNGNKFYIQWANYYFGKRAAPDVVKAYEYLDKAQSGDVGYVSVLSSIGNLIKRFRSNAQFRVNSPRAIARLQQDIAATRIQIEALDTAWRYVSVGLATQDGPVGLYHDLIELPITLLRQILVVKASLAKCLLADVDYRRSRNREELRRALNWINHARITLKRHIRTRTFGDLNPRWKGWYDIWKRRPNGGFPTLPALASIQKRLKCVWLSSGSSR